MAKRKRSSTSFLDTPTNAGKKRREEADSPSHPHGDVDYDREYKVRCILDEQGDKYLIDWENDEETGEKFEPTWEPKANANQLAIDEWEERQRANQVSAEPSAAPAKRGRGRPRKYPVGQAPWDKPATARAPATPVAKRPRGRPRKRVIHSSSTTPSPAPRINTPESGPAPAPSSSADDSEPPLEIEESDTENPVIVDQDFSPSAAQFEDADLQVQPSEPPSSYRAGAYEKVSSQGSSVAQKSSLNHSSSLSASQPVQSARNELSYSSSAPQPQSQPISTQSGKGASLVIQDSQSQQVFDESSNFQGFSPDPESQRPSTLHSQAIPERDQSPAEQSRPSTGVSVALDSGASSQAVLAADTVAGAVQEERDSAATVESSKGDETAGFSEQPQRESQNHNQTSQQGEDEASPVATKEPVASSAKLPTQTQNRNTEYSDSISNTAQVQSQQVGSDNRELSETGFESPPARAESSADASHQVHTSPKASTQTSSVEHQIREELSRSLGADRQTASPASISRQQSQPASNSTQTQRSGIDGADAERPIVVSSNEERDVSPLRSLEYLNNSSWEPDFEPPPAGQKPLPSSAVRASPAVNKPLESSATVNQISDFSRFWPSTSRQEESQDYEDSQQQDLLSQQERPSRPERPSQQNNSSSDHSSFPFQTQIRPALEPPADIRARTNKDNISNRRAASVESEASPDSSPLPPVPSQSLAQVFESAPSRLRTPETMAKTPPRETMESNTDTPSNQGQSLKVGSRNDRQENGQNGRSSDTLQVPHEQPASSLPPAMSAEVAAARRAARLSVPLEGARSPSTVPAHEPTPEITREEQTTSERYDTLLPQAQSSSSRTEAYNSNGNLTHTDHSSGLPQDDSEKDPESANVHIVPVGLFGIQRDSYLQSMWLHDAMTKEFLREQNPSEQLLQQAEVLFERLRDIVMHPDLVNIEALSQVSTPERQAQWDCDASAKFRFVREFLKHQAGRDIHVGLVVRGRKVADMLETFLVGSEIAYKTSYRSEQDGEEENKSGLRATIVDLDRPANHVESADVVIAMDGLIPYQDPIIRAYRKHVRQPNMSWANDWAGLYILVAPRTIEHIERSIVPSLSRQARARTLMTAIDHFHDHFTKAGGQSQLSLLKQAAQDVVDYLDDPESEWPLEELPAIENLDSQTDSGQEHQSSGGQESSGSKRPLGSPEVEMSSGDAAKRQRLDPEAPTMPATINPQDVEITHVSDSLGKGTQSGLMDADPLYVPMEPSATEQHLREVLEEQQNRLEEHVKALEDLQYRHEAQRVDLVEARRGREEAVATATAAVERMTITEANSALLRTERTELKEKLAEANRKLLDHSVPERAEFEALRLSAEQIKADKEKAEKREQAAQNELKYSRDMYQDCSSRARDLALEKGELEKELAEVSVLAKGEAARARQISQDTRHKALERENMKLKAILKNHETSMKFKDEEITRLKEATRGRMGTRQSSVPRSPRVGSPIKGRVGASSRQASPAAGDVRGGRGGHPLRRSD